MLVCAKEAQLLCPKQLFASPESGHSNSDKLTFAGEVGGTPLEGPRATAGGATPR